MKLTNNKGLPQTVVNAIQYARSSYQPMGDIGVTTLIAPLQQKILRSRYSHMVEEDASDSIYSLMGTAVHDYLVQHGSHADTITEESLEADFEIGADRPVSLGGTFDLLEHRPGEAGEMNVLVDYKVSSIYSASEPKPEWIQQVNIYNLLLHETGRVHGGATAARIALFLRDWSKIKAGYEKDYPSTQVVVHDIPLHPLEQVKTNVEGMLAEYVQHLDTPDEDLPECTADERWARGESWAVFRNMAQRALRVVYSEEEAQGLVKELRAKPHRGRPPTFRIVHRPGKSIRCQHYCPVARWCVQNAMENGG